MNKDSKLLAEAYEEVNKKPNIELELSHPDYPSEYYILTPDFYEGMLKYIKTNTKWLLHRNGFSKIVKTDEGYSTTDPKTNITYTWRSTNKPVDSASRNYMDDFEGYHKLLSM